VQRSSADEAEEAEERREKEGEGGEEGEEVKQGAGVEEGGEAAVQRQKTNQRTELSVVALHSGVSSSTGIFGCFT
jgi:hypothetical protein